VGRLPDAHPFAGVAFAVDDDRDDDQGPATLGDCFEFHESGMAALTRDVCSPERRASRLPKR
jgi:hypothetical protein